MMFIKGNFLYAPAPDRLEVRTEGYLRVEGEKVEGFYREIPPELAGEPVADYGEALIIPAFNDLHIHAPQMVNRGIGYDKELIPWLETYTFPVEERYSDLAFAERAYKAFLVRMWAAGTLRFSAFATVHKESTWRLMELTEQSGLSALIGKVNMDRNSPDGLREDTGASLAETEELICRSREELSHVGYILTPRFVPSTTGRMMDGLGRLGEKYDLPVQSHLSENRSEVAWVRQLHPDIPTYTQVYEAYGLLRPGKTIMAHAIYLSEAERALLRESRVMLAHCPESNLDLASGVMLLRRYLREGLRCCIASDVAGGGSTAMGRHIVSAVRLSKANWLAYPDQAPITLTEGFYLATKASGSFFGQVGSFEPGYDFDALVVEGDDLMERTPFERLEQFLYDGDDRDIKARYCRGKLVERPFQ